LGRLLIVLLGLLLGSCNGMDEHPPFSGPLPYRSIMPLSLIFPHPPPETAVPMDAGRTRVQWNTLYGSVFINESGDSEKAVIDGEFMRTSLYVRHGLGGRIEVGAELPFVHYSSGFLDGFIENFHDFFDLPQGKRDKNPDDQYQVSYEKDGYEFFSADEDGIHLADIPLYLKIALVEPAEEGFGLAARGTLELPTGDEDKGYGNGKVDGGLGVIAQQSFLTSWACYANLDYMFNASPGRFEGVSAANVLHGSLAVEKAFTEVVALVLQTDIQTPRLIGFNTGQFDVPEWSATAGLAWRMMENGMLKFFFTEGLTTHNAPDFVVGLGVGYDF
jgi:hypothetical protein